LLDFGDSIGAKAPGQTNVIPFTEQATNSHPIPNLQTAEMRCLERRAADIKTHMSAVEVNCLSLEI
jgi:hypothetical protein